MSIGVTRELIDGKCEKGHSVEILTNGYGFCPACSVEGDLNHTLYKAQEGYITPGTLEYSDDNI
tara:strand:- start:831 stop:1022 length:192 start_codon:yes stop_codon:yes gene_type:complete